VPEGAGFFVALFFGVGRRFDEMCGSENSSGSSVNVGKAARWHAD